MNFKNETERIRKIMNDWDPILSGESKPDEYDSYIPIIIKLKNSRIELFQYLESILKNEMGLPYNSKNPDHVREIENVIEKISL